MDETITKKQAIEAISKANGVLYWNNTLKASLIKLINEIPSKESESFEWCTDCKEYDQEAHCCHRWSKMIRKTVEEMQIVRCKDCKHRDPEDKKCDCGHDIEWQLPRDDYWYCADGERKEDG